MWHIGPTGTATTYSYDGKMIVVKQTGIGKWIVHVQGEPGAFKESFSSRGVAIMSVELWVQCREVEI